MKVSLKTQEIFIDAPRELVFQMLSAIGKGSLPGGNESSRVIERNGDEIIAEFLTPSGSKVYRTVERVVLYPPERITYQHLEGPLSFSEEAFTLEDTDDGCRLSYWGVIECKAPFLPGAGWLIAWTYARSKYNSIIQDHMARLKAAAEARAARSHIFPRKRTVQGE